jgi:hypothetical protein
MALVSNSFIGDSSSQILRMILNDKMTVYLTKDGKISS